MNSNILITLKPKLFQIIRSQSGGLIHESIRTLLSYVKVFTPSSEETGTSPSTQYQFDLARLLVQELKELGVKDADVDEHCYVYRHIPATRGYESRQKLGLSLIWIQSLISAIIRYSGYHSEL